MYLLWAFLLVHFWIGKRCGHNSALEALLGKLGVRQPNLQSDGVYLYLSSGINTNKILFCVKKMTATIL